MWHNGRRYVGGTASPRNANPRNPIARQAAERRQADEAREQARVAPLPTGEVDEHGVPVEGTPERPYIPEWNDAVGAVAPAATDTHLHTGERLQKVIAAAGVASRRVAENLIAEGRVTVNGEVADELGRRVDPDVDEIAVDGVAVQADSSKKYIVLNKPTGVVSSMLDERGRPDLSQFADRYDTRLFNVGRLDAETSGLLVLTNDGALAHVLAHPSFGVSKTYIAKVEGTVLPATIQQLQHGVELEDGPIVADKARLMETSQGSSMVEITLHSGRNRIVRRMLDAVGHPVEELVRRSFGPINLGTLPAGKMRDLTGVELGQILTIARQHGATVPALSGDEPEQTED